MTTTTLYDTKYFVCYYGANPNFDPAPLPIMIRGQYVCDSLESAQNRAIECAREDAVKLSAAIQKSDKVADVELNIDESLTLDNIVKPGFYARWIPALNDHSCSDTQQLTHCTLGLFYSRPKGGWISGEYAGRARPQRYYAISIVKCGIDTSRVVHDDDDDTLNDEDSDATSSLSSSSSSSDDDEEHATRALPDFPSSTQTCACGRTGPHTHVQSNTFGGQRGGLSMMGASYIARRRRRNRNRSRNILLKRE